MSELTVYTSALLRFTPGQRTALYDRLQPQLVARGLSSIAAYASRARAHDHETSKLEARWEAQEYRGRHSVDLQDLDPEADRVISSVHSVARGQVGGLPADDPLTIEVEAMLTDVFPNGVKAVTGQPFVEQALRMETCVDKLENDHAQLVQTLGMSALVGRLIEMTREYRAAVQAGVNRISFDTVEAMRTRGHVYLIEIVAMIMAAYHDSDIPAHASARDELLDMVRQGNEEVRRTHRVRRARGKSDGGATPDETAPDETPDIEPDADAAIEAAADGDIVPGTETVVG